jgi:alpha-tubulin suppressor-like RCC1 family protein
MNPESMKIQKNLIQTCPLMLALLCALTAGAQPVVTQIAAGGNHSLFLKTDGSLWVMGDNTYGQLGDKSTDSGNFFTNRPEQILPSGVIAIAAGGNHSLFVKSDGSLWVMGDDTYGQLGDGHVYGVNGYLGTNTPEQITVASNVTAVAAGSSHSLFRESDGSLWAMGLNSSGQLGDGTTNNSLVPEKIVPSGVLKIAAGDAFSLFTARHNTGILTTTELWTMGDNTYGQLGNGNGYSDYTNVPVKILSSMLLLDAVITIAGGSTHSLLIKGDGSLWAMGYNHYGQLGDGTVDPGLYNSTNLPELIVSSNVTAIAGGSTVSFLVKGDGSLWGMGSTYVGQLGNGSYTEGGDTNRPELIVSNNVTAVASRGGHTLFIEGGSLWGMGLNTSGQLGDGNPNDFETNRPILIVTGTPGYNLISAQLVNDGSGRLSLPFVGIPGTNYALERSFSLISPSWVAQTTNTAGAGGVLTFTNAPNAATNNYWRIRSVP